MRPAPARVDLALVGGGLANGLLAARLRERRPDLSLLVLEAGPLIGGNHTWSFHAGDVSPAAAEWLSPFVAHRWQGYEVRFPIRKKRVGTGYASVSSERFRQCLQETLGPALVTDAPVASLGPTNVTTADGQRIEAGAVIDGRGQRPTPHLRLGFQKFLGQEWECAAPHGLAEPIVMDATVAQADGYRFIYVLPFSPTRLLIEDTYYADGATLDPEPLRQRIAAYAADRGWILQDLVREEDGILPIALGGDIDALLAETRGVPTIGLASALFHPTTGYSLPDAVRVADLVAGLPDLSAPALSDALKRHTRDEWTKRGFFRMLNRLLFEAGDPAERYRILEHFYRLPDDLVARFYAAQLNSRDKIRIFAGKPPVSVRNAIRVLVKGRPGRTS